MVTVNKSLIEIRQNESKANARFYLCVLIMLLVLGGILMLNTFVFFNVQVDGESMKPTLSNGDILIANRLKEADYGDIVIIENAKPDSDDWLIKRVIAKEGDLVEIRDDKCVWINGKKLVEPYVIYPDVSLTEKQGWENRRLEKGEIFYLGDNRVGSSSADSRTYGACQESQIVGVVCDWSLKLRPVLNGVVKKW